MYWYILVHTSMDWYVLVYTGMYWYVMVYTGMYWYVMDEDEKKRFAPSELLLYKVAVEYRYITVQTGTYLYVLVHTGTYLYILVHTMYILKTINALAM